MSEQYEQQMVEQPVEQSEVDEVDVAQVLSEYHRKQLLENMFGPGVSLVMHIIVLTLMIIFVTNRPQAEIPAIEVSIVEEEIKEIEPEVLEEIQPEDQNPTLEDIAAVTQSDAETEDVGVNTSIADFSDAAPETDDNMETHNVMDVINNNSPLHMAGIYGGRTNAGRKSAVAKYGGSKGGQNVVTKALKWLAMVQNDDGSWGNQSPAHTGMALLTFLAHGETPLSEQYGTTVQKAMKWLVDTEMATPTGDMGQNAYGHGIAIYALCESYGMTRIPFLRTAMERALDVIIKGQQAGGGFNYGYDKGPRWDGSVAAWQNQALKAGYVAGATNQGLEDAIRKAITFLRRTAYASYKFGYASAGSGGNMTGAGTVGLQLLGAGGSPEAMGGVTTISTERLGMYQALLADPGKWNDVMGPSLYGFYYDTQGVFNSQGAGAGIGAWKEWRNVFEKVLLRAQQPEGYWEVKTGHGLGQDLPGRILATCWCCLQLEVYYRYLPSFDIGKMDQHKVSEVAADINEAGGKKDGGPVIQIE